MKKCKICNTKTDVIFNINLKATPICENCAASIFLQQAKWYTQTKKIEVETKKEQLDIKIDIFKFLHDLQDRYSLNDFCPADIILTKNGDTLYARVKDLDGNVEIILDSWTFEEFKDYIVY